MSAEEIAEALGGRRYGDYWLALCPAHEDHNPSLSITERDGRLLVHCHAGCPQEAVIKALRCRQLWVDTNLRVSAVRERKNSEKAGRIVAEYIYTDEAGTPLFRVTRHEPKTFRQWRPDGHGGWLPGLANSVRIVLYRLHEVIKAPEVFIVEGEKDVETLREHGFVATCNPGGAGKWRPDFAQYFKGKTVIVIPDTDEPGRRHGEQVVRNLRGSAKKLYLIDLAPDRVKDITEWFEDGHSEVELVNLLNDLERGY